MKNVNISEIQKRRYENYQKEEKNLVVTKVTNGYQVHNLKRASAYLVSKNPDTGEVECECRDYNNFKQFNIKCKHKIAVIMQCSTQKVSNAINSAQVAEGNINNIKEELIMKDNVNSNNQDHNSKISEEVKDNIQAMLSKQFPVEIIRYREGQKKKQLAYVETAYYIDRLNETFNYQWNWEILSETVTEHEAYCKGRLTVEINNKTVIKEAYGGKDLTVVDIWDKQTQQVIGKKPFSIADDIKSASSDALKKACSLLGIGLHLYIKPQVPQNTPQTYHSSATSTTSSKTAASVGKPSSPADPSTTPASKSSSGGNGKNGNGKGGNGSTNIDSIIKRW